MVEIVQRSKSERRCDDLAVKVDLARASGVTPMSRHLVRAEIPKLQGAGAERKVRTCHRIRTYLGRDCMVHLLKELAVAGDVDVDIVRQVRIGDGYRVVAGNPGALAEFLAVPSKAEQGRIVTDLLAVRVEHI